MAKRYWRITVYDSTEKLFEYRIRTTHIGSSRLDQLLQILAAKHGLCDEEIILDRLSRNTREHKSLLNVTGSYCERSCGDNPFVTALAVDEDGKRIKQPSWANR